MNRGPLIKFDPAIPIKASPELVHVKVAIKEYVPLRGMDGSHRTEFH